MDTIRPSGPHPEIVFALELVERGVDELSRHSAKKLLRHVRGEIIARTPLMPEMIRERLDLIIRREETSVRAEGNAELSAKAAALRGLLSRMRTSRSTEEVASMTVPDIIAGARVLMNVPESAVWPQSHKMGALAAWWGYASRDTVTSWYRRVHADIAGRDASVAAFLGAPDKRYHERAGVDSVRAMGALKDLIRKQGEHVFSVSYTRRCAALSAELGLHERSLAEHLRLDAIFRKRLSDHHPLLSLFVSGTKISMTQLAPYAELFAELSRSGEASITEPVRTFIDAARIVIAARESVPGDKVDFLLAVGQKLDVKRAYADAHRIYKDNFLLLKRVAPDVVEFMNAPRPRRIRGATVHPSAPPTGKEKGPAGDAGHVAPPAIKAMLGNLTVVRARDGMPSLAEIAEVTGSLLECRPDLWFARGEMSYDERVTLVAAQLEMGATALTGFVSDPIILQKLGERNPVAADFIGYPEVSHGRYAYTLTRRQISDRALSVQRYMDPLAPYYRKMQNVGHGAHPYAGAYASGYYRENYSHFANTTVSSILGVPPLPSSVAPLQQGVMRMPSRI